MTRPTGTGVRLAPPIHSPDEPFRVVFVCTGNICRSPMAEVVTRTLAGSRVLTDRRPLGSLLRVSSAGTGPWHDGEPMDERAAAALRRAGYPEHRHVARQVVTRTLGTNDLVVALDRRHHQTLRSLGSPPERLFLLRAFDPRAGAAADVPDPYYGSAADFDSCLAMIEAGCRGVVAAMERLLDPGDP
ncbi:MAG TPA: low molecular weight protein-tyrosine-phosphatase [Acidimicrobiales bacterium]|nr:low molecular weight protein-tyrosine-phosphatase [Acidimicrobiales bacterium]